MPLATYLKLTSDPRWKELDDSDDDLPPGDVTETIERLQHVNYGDYATSWSGPKGDDPRSEEARNNVCWPDIHDEFGGLNISQVEAFAHHVLTRIETSPPDAWTAPADLRCLLGTTGGQWGVYSVGVIDPRALNGVSAPDGGPSANRLELSLDPTWLDRDFRNLNSRKPWLYASEAEWALDHLRAALRISVPPTAVLRASLPPTPYGLASGDKVSWPPAGGAAVRPKPGLLGPAVKYKDPSGNQVEGFITAGHVAQPQGPNQVDAWDSAGTLMTAQVDRSRMPGGLGTQLGRYLNGAVDGALVSAGGHAVQGLGPAGAAGPKCDVKRVGGTATPDGQVVGYAKWVATGNCAWGNCYTVVASDLSAFSEPGDSGAAVRAGHTVLGIVMGGAAPVAGCAHSGITYVQDIARLRRALRCTLIP
jgi:hypothetical protein